MGRDSSDRTDVNRDDNRLWKSISLGWKMMTLRERKSALWLGLLSTAVSSLGIIGVAGVMPVVQVIVEPESITESPFIRPLHEFVGKPDIGVFLLELVAAALFLASANLIGNFFVQYLTKRFGLSCQNRLAEDFMNQCVAAPYHWFLSQNATVLARMLFNDILMWSNGSVRTVINLFTQVSLLMWSGLVVVIASPWPGIVAMFGIGVVALAIVRAVQERIGFLSARQRHTSGAALKEATSIVSGIKDIKLSSRESEFVGFYIRQFRDYGSSMNRLKLLQLQPAVIMGLLGQFGLAAIAMILWRTGSSTGEIAAQMVLLVLLTQRFMPATTSLINTVNEIERALPHVEGVHTMLCEMGWRRENTVPTLPAVYERDSIDWHSVRLERVSFSYPSGDDNAVDDVDIVLDRGGWYGFAGRSGSGKTTLVDLILGLLEPDQGAVLIDGKPLSQFGVRQWQRRIGYVPQNPFIADDSLRANIAFGVPVQLVDDDRIDECLRLASLEDLSVNLEEGLSTLLGDRGMRLSGGQCQRIAIARALYDKPDLLVLDEATSALDTLNERKIQNALDAVHGQVTTLTIAHRFSTIRKCDAIFLLEDGRVVGEGQYDELRDESQLFRDMTVAT